MRTEGKEKNIIGLAVLLVLVFEAALISASAASVLDDRHHGLEAADEAVEVPEAPGRPLTVGLTSRSVDLSWAPPFNSDSVPVNRYIIHIRPGEETDWKDSSVSVVETKNNETHYKVTGLSPFTTYSFRVTAVNARGKSKPSHESFYVFTLREKPSGKPTITAAHNTSSTSIQLIWRPPPKSSINGEFLGYAITFRPRIDTNNKTANSASGRNAEEVHIKDPEVTQYTILDLVPYTQYLVSLQVRNAEGLGPPTKVAVMTDEGVPSRPLKVAFKEVTNSSVSVHWQEPTTPNGIIAGYRIYYMHDNFTDVKTVRSTEHQMYYALRGLRSYTHYKIWVKAFTFKNEGRSSAPVEVLTDVSGPDAPLIRNLSCVNDITLGIEWTMPIHYDRSIDYFVLQHRIQPNSRHLADIVAYTEITVKNAGANPNAKDFEHNITNLTTDVVHDIRIAGITRSVYRKSQLYKGRFSSVKSKLLPSDCIYYHTETAIGASNAASAEDNVHTVIHDYREQQVGIVIGLTATLACIFLIALAILVWRRFFGESYYFLAESPSSLACTTTANGGPGSAGSTAMTNATSMTSGVSGMTGVSVSASTPDVANHELVQSPTQHPGIPIHLFTRHVLERHANENLGFLRSFEHIETLAATSPTPKENIASVLSHNADKNRYKNVLAFNHTRVRLDTQVGNEHQDYINANYIDGFHRPKAYIATQGPVPGTMADFWQMVWEQNTHVVVMITNFIEGGKQKCDQYWPDKDMLGIYGRIQIHQVCIDIQESYTLRVLRLKLLRQEGDKFVDDENCPERDVLHFQYTSWPDHGTPGAAGQILAFIQKSSQSSRDTDGPIVVHCSAGVGRTGTYIVIDAMLKQMQTIGRIDVDGYLSYIRTQRNFLIQTVEQYVFVHDVLAEAVGRRMVVAVKPPVAPPSSSTTSQGTSTASTTTSSRH